MPNFGINNSIGSVLTLNGHNNIQKCVVAYVFTRLVFARILKLSCSFYCRILTLPRGCVCRFCEELALAAPESDEIRRNVYLCVCLEVDASRYSGVLKDFHTTCVASATERLYSRSRSCSIGRRPVSCGFRTTKPTVRDWDTSRLLALTWTAVEKQCQILSCSL